MNDLGRNRIIIASIAAIALIIGMMFIGGAPKTTSSSPATKQVLTNAAEIDNGQTNQFMVRDYSEFAGASDVDLPSSDWFGLLAGMMIKLGFVIALIYAAVRLLRRYVYRRGAPTTTKKPVSLLGSLNLTPSRTVYVLEVGRKVLVVGATPNQLSLLTEVTDPEAIDEVRSQSAETTPMDQFSSLLKAATRQLGDGENTVTLSENSIPNTLQLKVQEGREFMQSKLALIRQSMVQN